MKTAFGSLEGPRSPTLDPRFSRSIPFSNALDLFACLGLLILFVDSLIQTHHGQVSFCRGPQFKQLLNTYYLLH
jgi:hypothetical protein